MHTLQERDYFWQLSKLTYKQTNADSAICSNLPFLVCKQISYSTYRSCIKKLSFVSVKSI